MTELLCRVCDREIFKNESERISYLATCRKKDDKSIYKKYVNNNINLDEVDKTLISYSSIHNKKFGIYFFKCDF